VLHWVAAAGGIGVFGGVEVRVEQSTITDPTDSATLAQAREDLESHEPIGQLCGRTQSPEGGRDPPGG
jgi:hypothetical protein